MCITERANCFFKKANEKFNNKFDYSNSIYVNNSTKIEIKCPIHGIFYQSPMSHLRGHGCPKCAWGIISDKKKLSNEEFIKKANDIHNGKYDYSLVKYNGVREKIKIICPIHGVYYQSPMSHLRGYGCPKCAWCSLSKEKSLSVSDIVEKLKNKFQGKIQFNKEEILNKNSIIKFHCLKHGYFYSSPKNILNTRHFCPKCSKEELVKKSKLNTCEFIEKAIKIHGDKYDYSKVNYEHTKKKVMIKCPIHGYFYQKPYAHLNKCGCPKCRSSKLEIEIRKLLTDNKILFQEQKTFDWLKFKGKLFLDFYLPNENIAIECQGRQHFQCVNSFGGEKEFKKTLKRDKIKRAYCKDNGIKILYFSNLSISFPYEVITSKDVLIKEIKNG